jgi:hypothetical protein
MIKTILTIFTFLTLQAAIFAFSSPLDDYHVVIFAYETSSGVLDPAETHVFATWVHSKDGIILEERTISWCPEEGEVGITTKVVKGRNKSLKQTLNDANGHIFGYHVMRTDASFFDQAKEYHENMKDKKYKALDKKTRPDGLNCIHACSDLAGYLDTKLAVGLDAGTMVADHYKTKNKAWPTNDKYIVEPMLKYCDAKLPKP